MNRILTFCLSLLIVFMPLSIFAKSLSGTKIMQKVEAMPTPKNVKSKMHMKIINKRGRVRKRDLLVYRQGEEKQIMWFLSPADVKGTSFLRLDNQNGGEDMWLYLPAFRKSRRIVSSAKQENFMGSDFTYEDMGTRKAEEYTHQRLSDAQFLNWQCFVVESIPNASIESGYSKIISYVDKKSFFVVREDFFDKHSQLSKTKTISKLKRFRKYWLFEQMKMEDLQKQRSTVLAISNIKVDTRLRNYYFTTKYLRRMPRK